MDQSKKTMRHFYCRDVLWETFEQMANDFDCSIDYLVNEAMRYYARSKNYQSPGGPQVTGQQPVGGRRRRSERERPEQLSQAAERAGRQPGCRRNQPVPQAAMARQRHGPPAQPRAVPRRRPPATPRRARAAPRPRRRPVTWPAQHSPAPMPARAPAPMPHMGSAGPTLFLIYNGQRYPVTKDQFIIGRGSKTSDLPIKDGNISRKHAAVIRRNGTFYIKDLGSTNGIDYKGMRIDNKRIDEGDVFHLCDYELRFTYRAD